MLHMKLLVFIFLSVAFQACGGGSGGSSSTASPVVNTTPTSSTSTVSTTSVVRISPRTTTAINPPVNLPITDIKSIL